MQAILQRVSFALPAAVWAAIVFLFLLLLAVVAPQWLAHSDPLLADPLNAQLPPSAQHWLGTDQLGRDLLTRVIYGSRYSLLISVAAMALAVLFGTLLGLAAALARGIVDELLSRAVDVISAFPDLLLALMLIAFTGPGTSNLIIALGVASVPRFARVVRAQTWRVMTSGYVEQARTFGLSRSTLILRHILPHAIAQVPALATLGVPYAVRAAADTLDPAEELISAADAASADFIIIGLRRRSPVGKLLLGSNAQRVLLDASCPVLAVKAESE